MITINQKLTITDYRKAIAFHYFSYKYTIINPIIGGMILISILISFFINIPYISNSKLIALMAGAFLLFRPIFYIENVLKSFISNKLITLENNVLIFDDLIKTQSGNNKSEIELNKLFGYRMSRNYILLYFARNQFIVLDKTKVGDIAILLNTLKSNGIKNKC